MSDTREFVDKVRDTQAKDRKNKQHQGQGTQGQKVSSRQHSTNK
ncbi:DUF4023 family protein [Cohnella sp. REN36]|nr:DUF4023 family protein [Cohnella sp. REN36]MCC3376111.1 DUF4023 family protein [Cohnella sp. REN36]